MAIDLNSVRSCKAPKDRLVCEGPRSATDLKGRN